VADVVSVELDAREVDWEFAPGLSISGFAYNGQVPGPTIEANVGDTVEARLTNKLPEATIVHWHGIRLPASMDGTGAVQRPVEPGETFTYSFVVPDAGTFWYHSHHNETEQIERGLYGPLIVRGPDEPKLDRERILFLDDLKLDAEGNLSPFGDSHEHHAGREGDVRLVNGREEPELEIAGGQVERWRIVNAANTKYVLLSIGGRPFSIIGTDGGLISQPRRAAEVLVTPGQRVELAVGPFDEGEVLAIEGLPYDRGQGESPLARFGTLRVGASAPSEVTVGGSLKEIESLAARGTEATRTINMKELMHGGHSQRADSVQVGELQVWDLVNDTGSDHPFHLHGFFFQIVDVNGEPPPVVSWEDTVNVAKHTRVRIAWVADNRPGQWMYHCHILEHHAMGMMAHFAVVP
jgi:FtsP/CotA-like multicopper oxidase with cupredoxin domain